MAEPHPTFKLRRAKRVREEWMVGVEVTPELFPGDSAIGQSIKAYVFANGERGAEVTGTLLENPALEGNTATVTLKGGTDGQDYLVDFEVTTTDGDVIVQTLELGVRGA